MSLLLDAERFAMRVLPPKLTQRLQQLKHRLPIKLAQSPPVVQMYLNDEHTRSFVGVHNYYSVLLPDVETAALAELHFFAPDGKRLLQHRVALDHFAADAVDVKALFDARDITAPHGVVTVQITPRTPRDPRYRELGLATAHFFMFFRDRATGSVEQTHPLSTTDRANRPSEQFTSSQILSTAKLHQLVAFQYNPGPHAHTLEHSLVDVATGEVAARSRLSIPALGSAKSVFDITALAPRHAHLLFRVDALPSSNAKPMLRRVFAGGRHSMSHA